jgi:hypothetical protein
MSVPNFPNKLLLKYFKVVGVGQLHSFFHMSVTLKTVFSMKTDCTNELQKTETLQGKHKFLNYAPEHLWMSGKKEFKQER